jgi:AcrR family transcriptional regulator
LTLWTGFVNNAAMPRPLTATRERILDAAFGRFASYGFRRTSMADIAAAAGVSRAALYLQFRNKEAIFRALSDALHDAALRGAEAALAAEAPLAERLRLAVEAKSLRFVEIAYGSPHGGELLDESNRLCGDLPADAGRRFQVMLARVFRAAARAGEIDLGTAGLTPAAAAELFHSSVVGLKGPGVPVEVFRDRLAVLARVFAAGLSPGAMPARTASRPPGRVGAGRRTARRGATV